MKTVHIRFLIILLIVFSIRVSGQNTGKLVTFATGLSNPVSITHAGDSRLFVVDQRGLIRIVSSEGIVGQQAFLDIQDRVVYGGERGLLGLAFHPQYKTNGYFYVNYIGAGNTTFISRFKVDASNPDKANPASELKLLSVIQPYQNHNGGDLKFGTDGYLYIGLGDGGSGGDPQNLSQNRMTLLGKILRIDVNNGDPYKIPPTNPFLNLSSVLPEIWALGLRNPWRFSFDRLNGNLWIADVGQNKFEEINLQPANSPGGENYGWRCYEGNTPYNTSGCPGNTELKFPVHTYPLGTECSITGGFVYRGNASSPLYGRYFFSDYCSDKIWTLRLENDAWIKEDFGQFSGNNFSTFGEDASGQLYIAGLKSGKIYRISDGLTSVSLKKEADDFRIVRSPDSQRVKVELLSGNPKSIQLTVFDLNGKKLISTTVSSGNPETDLSVLPSGVYILSIAADENVRNFKFVR